MKSYALVFFAALAACSSSSDGNTGQTGPTADAGGSGASAGSADVAGASDVAGSAGSGGAAVAKAPCAPSFGTALSATYGRVDGTLYSTVTPPEQSCAAVNMDHLVLEVQMNGAIYRLLINVESDDAGEDPKVLEDEIDVPLVGDPWSEGFHTTGISLDYANDLHTKSTDYVAFVKDDLIAKVSGELVFGEQISVYTLGFGADGGHDIHRNSHAADGAVVLHANTDHPHWLLFHFASQSF